MAQWSRTRLQCRRHGRSPWMGKVPWRRIWQPLQCSRLGNPMDRGAWWATVHGVTKETRLSNGTTSHMRLLKLKSNYIRKLENSILRYTSHSVSVQESQKPAATVRAQLRINVKSRSDGPDLKEHLFLRQYVFG